MTVERACGVESRLPVVVLVGRLSGSSNWCSRKTPYQNNYSYDVLKTGGVAKVMIARCGLLGCILGAWK